MQLSKNDRIEGAIDKGIAGNIAVSNKGGIVITNGAEIMEFAKMMSLGGVTVPDHLRGQPGACLAICIQAFEWAMNPFAVASKSYVVSNRIGYEASLFQAVLLKRAPIKGRIKMTFDGAGPQRTCRVYATALDSDEVYEYVSPETGKIKPKNSPLWVNDPDQQLFYFSVRSFARRHFPDVMMGVYTADELIDNPIPVESTVVSRTDELNRILDKGGPILADAKLAPPAGMLQGQVKSESVSQQQGWHPGVMATDHNVSHQPVTPAETVDTGTGEVTEQPTPNDQPEVHPVQDLYDSGPEQWPRALSDAAKAKTPTIKPKEAKAALERFAKEKHGVAIDGLTVEQLAAAIDAAKANGVNMATLAINGA